MLVCVILPVRWATNAKRKAVMSAESGSNENPTRTEEERIAYIQRQIDHAPSFPTIPREDMDFLLGVIGKQAEKVRAAKRALDRWNEHSFADPDSVYGPL